MAKLTDTQLIVLSKAAARDDGIASIPGGLNKAAAAKVGASLVSRKLMRKVRSKPDMPVWREDEEGRGTSLVITREGREAIGLEDGENDSSNRSLGAEERDVQRRQRLAASHHTRGADRASQTRLHGAVGTAGWQAIAISHR